MQKVLKRFSWSISNEIKNYKSLFSKRDDRANKNKNDNDALPYATFDCNTIWLWHQNASYGGKNADT